MRSEISKASRAPVRLLILASMTLLCAGCVSSPAIVMNDAIKCGELIPAQIRDPVPSAVLGGPTQGALAEFGVSQTARLGQANDEKSTAIGIVDNCERLKGEAAKKIESRTLWQRLTPWRE